MEKFPTATKIKFVKIWSVSFPTPSSEFSYDLSFKIYSKTNSGLQRPFLAHFGILARNPYFRAKNLQNVDFCCIFSNTSFEATETTFCPNQSGKSQEVFSRTNVFVAVRNFYIRNFYCVAAQKTSKFSFFRTVFGFFGPPLAKIESSVLNMSSRGIKMVLQHAKACLLAFSSKS